MTRITVYDGRHGWCDGRPTGGVFLHVHYAVQDSSYIDWYPTIGEARAALGELASHHERPIINDHVDLTPGEGYVESEAWVSESPEFGLAQ